jgi:threonine/homoserine/homoserine lactone efflux protein
MKLITYFFLGLIAAILGALPLGTTNVAVINTTIKENLQNAMKIVFTAAVAELILILVALNFNTQIEFFIDMNIWIQYTIVVILLVVGIIFVKGRKECVKDVNEECVYIKKRRIHIPKQLLGFILGLINPSVLVFWILVITFLGKKMIYLNVNMDFTLLGLFLAGAFLGKVLTLYAYGRFSHMLRVRVKNITTTVNRVIGVLLICISIFQVTKLVYA